MADYPTQGDSPWDVALLAYLDDRFEAAAAGTEMGNAERLTTFTTTNTSTAGGGVIPSLTVVVVGEGRPVDVNFFAANVYHSVADTSVSFALRVNGSTVSDRSQTASVRSPLTTAGPSAWLYRRPFLDLGVQYTFTINVAGGAAGTSNVVAASFAPIQLCVSRR